MAPSSACTLSLKLLVDKRNQRVLFAEAGKEFADFLFRTMTLPAGTIIGLLEDKGRVGCLGNVYGSIENMDDIYIVPGKTKDTLVKPKPLSDGSGFLLLLPDVNTTSLTSNSRTLYRCSAALRTKSRLTGNRDHSCCTYVVNYYSARCPVCHRDMKTEVKLLEDPKGAVAAAAADGGGGEGAGYVKNAVTYMVMDDLEVKPTSAIFSISIMSKYGLQGFGDLEAKVVDFSMNEALKLLKASLHSRNVLTDVFLGTITV